MTIPSNKKKYVIWDNQLNQIKNETEVFNSKEQAYDSYTSVLYQQCLDGNCGYDCMTSKEIRADLKEKTPKEIFDMFGYELKPIIASDFFLYTKNELISELKVDYDCFADKDVSSFKDWADLSNLETSEDNFFLVTGMLEIFEQTEKLPLVFENNHYFKIDCFTAYYVTN